MVSEEQDYSIHFADPDTLVNWDFVQQVVSIFVFWIMGIVLNIPEGYSLGKTMVNVRTLLELLKMLWGKVLWLVSGKYTINDFTRKSVEVQRDLRSQVPNSLKVAAQVESGEEGTYGCLPSLGARVRRLFLDFY